MSAHITRRTVAAALGATVLPVLGVAQYSWKVFSPAQAEAVAALAEAIIPETGTPGAKAARVHEYIDRTLSENQAQSESFLAGLRWVEEKSAKLFGKQFARLTEAQQTDLLTLISDDEPNVRAEDRPGVAFFRQLKVMVCNGFYLSKVGLEQEIGFKGNRALADYPGCDG